MATVAPRRDMRLTLQTSSATDMHPRAAASARASVPPSDAGLPVTAPGTGRPAIIEYVSIIQAMVWLSVETSGAAISEPGPIRGKSSEVKRRVSLSSSPRDIRLGSQITPPELPPQGTFTVAVFQVIHEAS